MQNQYVGDVGDWGKYGLLRALSVDGVILGVLWYLVRDDGGPDGRHVSYLSRPDLYRAADPELFDLLPQLRNSLTTTAVEQSSVLPRATRFFSERLAFDALSALTPKGRQARLQERAVWFARAVQAMSGCNVVFVDPDNGFECKSVTPHSKKGPKFCTWDEARQLANGTEAFIGYHHLNRAVKGKNHDMQVRDVAAHLQSCVPDRRVCALRFSSYQSRAYLILVRPDDPLKIIPALKRFVASGWGRFFVPVVLDG